MPKFQLYRLHNRNKILMRLVWLRMIVLMVAALVILVYQLYFDKPLHFWCLYIVLMLAGVFSVLTLVFVRLRGTSERLSLLMQLLVDMGIVIVLVSFSGRSGNPFIYYLLVPVAIGATLLAPAMSWLLTLLSVISYSVLLYLDLEKHIRHLSEFQLHLLGMWVNFVASALLINGFVSNLAAALRDREHKLARAREQTLKNEQLIGIGTLAASTVHALGTPLSTMAVVLGEMQAVDGAPDEQHKLLFSQISRCKETLGRLSQLADTQRLPDSATTVDSLKDLLREHYQLMIPRVMPEFSVEPSTGGQRVTDNVLLKHALINLIDNAVSAAAETVSVHLKMSEDCPGFVQIAIVDDGPGLPEEYLDDFGEPTVSRNDGLGIGVFLANSTIEKLSGEIVLYNPDKALSGNTTVIVKLPLYAEEHHD